MRNYEIVLTDQCKAELKELPDRGGIVDEDGACVVPEVARGPENPGMYTPVGLSYSYCDVKQAQFFFNRARSF